MTTKETFLSLGAGSSHHETAETFDFDALDKFVSMLITTYINRRGKEVVKVDLSTEYLSQTSIFLTRMIEVGTVQFLSENHLISANEEENEELAMVTGLAINISMATVLQAQGVDKLGGNVFFAITTLYDLIDRVVQHIRNSQLDEGYIFSLVSINLMRMVNGVIVE